MVQRFIIAAVREYQKADVLCPVTPSSVALHDIGNHRICRTANLTALFIQLKLRQLKRCRMQLKKQSEGFLIYFQISVAHFFFVVRGSGSVVHVAWCGFRVAGFGLRGARFVVRGSWFGLRGSPHLGTPHLAFPHPAPRLITSVLVYIFPDFSGTSHKFSEFPLPVLSDVSSPMNAFWKCPSAFLGFRPVWSCPI